MKIKIFLILLVLFISISAVSAEGNFTALQEEINSSTHSLEIKHDYKYDNVTDSKINDGISINKTNFVINGNGHTIDASNQVSIFNIEGNNITISNLIFINGKGNDVRGGAIYSDSSLILNNVTFKNNYAKSGGAIYANEPITINNSTFTNNQATEDGGAINAINKIKIDNSLFTNNMAKWGGNIYTLGDLVINNSKFANSTSKYAAAIYTQKDTTVINSIFENLHVNETAGSIGAKFSESVEILNCTFINSTSNKNGGAIYIDYSRTNYPEGTIIANSRFINSSGDFGGALVQLTHDLTITNSTFTNNIATYNGGAICTSGTSLNLKNSSFISNKILLDDQFNGGAIYSDNGGLNLVSSSFINNSKNAIYSYTEYRNISSCEFTNNGEAIHCVFGSNKLTGNNYNEDILVLNDTDYVSVVCENGMKLELINNTITVENLPARYDLRDWGWVSSVKSQGKMGSCWTFGACGALESALLKATGIEYDFSENNLHDNMMEFSKYGIEECFEGGWQDWALEYSLSWFGPFPTEYDTYDELGKLSPIITTDKNIHVQDAIIVKNRENFTDNEGFKKAIMKYGSLHITYNPASNAPYYNSENGAQYRNDSTEQTHGVSLVGWDDNYPASNFLITPPGNGAWIIKNSWGNASGDKGFHYISYYDTSVLAYKYSVGYIFENTEDYTANYQTDLSGNLTIKEYANNVSYKVTYESIRNELISAVGTYFNDGEEYCLEIYVNDKLAHVQNGTGPYYGFHTVKLTKEIPIKEGDSFTAVMTKKSIPKLSESRQHYLKNMRFINEGDGWKDITLNDNTISLKVYTKDLSIYTEDLVKIYKNDSQFEVNVGEANQKIVFEINGNNYTRTSDANGTAHMNINLKPGNYSIKTTFNGTTVENTITVLPTLIAENLVKYFRNASQFHISLIDGAGKAVPNATITMNINGVFYNRTTNANGTAKLNINLEPGEYVLTATDPLTGLEMSYNITVLPVLTANDINMTYLDGTQFKAKLVDSKGNALANAQITFNINGVFYNRTTDENGTAKLNIKLMAGEYIITSQYENALVSNKITITAKED